MITAKHNLFDEGNDTIYPKGDFFDIKFYAEDLVKEKEQLIKVNLNQLRRKKQIVSHSQLDICIVKLANVDKGAIRYLNGVSRLGSRVTYSPYRIVEDNYLVKEELFLGEKVFTIGFPSSIGLKKTTKIDYDKPLLKRCALAGLSRKVPTYVIDCHVYSGNSGGPVFLERTDFKSYSIKLIGITIESIPFLDSSISKKDLFVQASSYAIVVPINHAIDLIKELK